MTKRETRQMLGIRALPSEVQRIDALAAQYGMSRTEYMVRAALVELPELIDERDRRLDDHEARLDRLERLVELGG